MNILILTTHLNVGGVTSYSLTLGRGLKKRGHNVYIASSNGEMLGEFIKSGIDYIQIPIKTKSEVSPKILFSLYKLLPLLKEKQINIIHANTRVTQVLAWCLGLFSGIPYVSTCHGFFRPHFFRKVFPFWGRKAVAISDEVRKHLVNDLKVREEKIRVVYNGIDTKKFEIINSNFETNHKSETKNKIGLSGGPVVGIIARLSDVKGHKYLIEAFKSVLKDIPNAQLLIIGEGKMKSELSSLAHNLGIEKNVLFLPSTPDTQKALSLMDVFVMPSLHEGLGLSLMEAMACAVPVIGSDIGGIRNLIKDSQTGLLVKPKDVPGLAAAIKQLLGDPEKASVYAFNARKFITENFSQEKMARETEEVYRGCLNVS